MELVSGVGAMKGGDAIDETAGYGCDVIVGEKLGVETKFAQVVHDKGSVAQGLVVTPTSEQGGFPRAEEAAENRHGYFSGPVHRRNSSIDRFHCPSELHQRAAHLIRDSGAPSTWSIS